MVLSFTTPGVTVAQLSIIEVSASGVSLDADHFLLGDPLLGGRARIAFPIQHTRVSVHLAIEGARGTATRLGTLCSGLIQPGQCLVDEPLNDHASIISFAGGIGIRLFTAQRFTARAIGEIGRGHVRADTRAESNDDVLSARKSLKLLEGGLEIVWRPSARTPVSLLAAFGLGKYSPSAGENSPDAYLPFENTFGVRSIRLGVAWQ